MFPIFSTLIWTSWYFGHAFSSSVVQITFLRISNVRIIFVRIISFHFCSWLKKVFIWLLSSAILRWISSEKKFFFNRFSSWRVQGPLTAQQYYKCNVVEGSISPTIYLKLLHAQIPKVQKLLSSSIFALFGFVRVKSISKLTLVKLIPVRNKFNMIFISWYITY
jgi:hypothetical protein